MMTFCVSLETVFFGIFCGVFNALALVVIIIVVVVVVVAVIVVVVVVVIVVFVDFALDDPVSIAGVIVFVVGIIFATAALSRLFLRPPKSIYFNIEFLLRQLYNQTQVYSLKNILPKK
uniref:Uncharacterized protein n=1 Tax=Glossina brevipalpis TaxID=37001 RepID=A0A1A9W671_9MUSC